MSERDSNAKRKIKEASIGGLAHRVKGAVPRQADASQEGQGPAGKESDRDVPADDAVPQQADASQEGPGAGRGRNRIGRKRFSSLLKRAIEGGENPVLVAREFGARRDALLMGTAAEIEEFERNIEATLHQLMHALAAVQKRVNHTIEESQGEHNMREAMLAYKRIKSRFWESLVQSIREEMEQFKANLRREFQAVEKGFPRTHPGVAVRTPRPGALTRSHRARKVARPRGVVYRYRPGTRPCSGRSTVGNRGPCFSSMTQRHRGGKSCKAEENPG